MNLYLLTQTETVGYDTFDAMVVAAKSEDEARKIHPYNNSSLRPDEDPWDEEPFFASWALTPEAVTVTLLGVAKRGTKAGIILTSFNAG